MVRPVRVRPARRWWGPAGSCCAPWRSMTRPRWWSRSGTLRSDAGPRASTRSERRRPVPWCSLPASTGPPAHRRPPALGRRRHRAERVHRLCRAGGVHPGRARGGGGGVRGAPGTPRPGTGGPSPPVGPRPRPQRRPGAHRPLAQRDRQLGVPEGRLASRLPGGGHDPGHRSRARPPPTRVVGHPSGRRPARACAPLVGRPRAPLRPRGAEPGDPESSGALPRAGGCDSGPRPGGTCRCRVRLGGDVAPGRTGGGRTSRRRGVRVVHRGRPGRSSVSWERTGVLVVA
jgi:hypothetical protein